MEKADFQKALKVFHILALGMIFVSLLVILYLVRDLLTPFVIAFAIAFLLNPIIDHMEGGGIHRTLSILIIIVLSGVVLFFTLRLGLPVLHAEIDGFRNNAPLYYQRITDGIRRGLNVLETNISFIPKEIFEEALQQKMRGFAYGLGDIDLLIKLINKLLTGLIIIPFAVFFFLKDGRRIRKILIEYVPNKYFETFLILLHDVNQQISNYIRAQLTDNFIVGVLAIITLYLLRIKYSLLIGVILAAVNLIPFVGPLMGLAFGSSLILLDTGSTIDLLKFVGAFLFIRILDDMIIWPLVLGQSIHVHPLLVIILILLGGFFHGIVGMLLAVPLYCAIKVSFQILYRGLIEYGNW